MRGRIEEQQSMFMLGNPESVVPAGHPLRKVKALADGALKRMSPTFELMYAEGGRSSIAPERLLKAQLLMALYTVRSERQLCEQLQYNLLFRWFLDMDATEAVFVPTVFTHNRDRLLEHEVAHEFFGEVIREARKHRLMSEEHFSCDGTLLEAWASMKSFRPKTEDESDDDKTPPTGSSSNRWVNFHREKRSNETHESKTDPEAKLMRKGWGKEAKLSFSVHALTENRAGLLVDLRVAEANGTAERDVALQMLDAIERPKGKRITVGVDKGYDAKDFIASCRERNVTAHVAQNNTRRRSAIDGRTTRHAGYAISQRLRMKIEECFGWGKTIGGLRKTMLRGIAKNQFRTYLIGAAYNLLRIAKLTTPQLA